MKKTIDFESWLPGFPGYYNTRISDVLDKKEDNFYNKINQARESKHLVPIDPGDSNMGYFKIYAELVPIFCKVVEEELIKKGIQCQVVSGALSSPKYYNYSNDSINATFKFTQEGLKKLQDTALKSSKLKNYIKETYTSCPGFISHYSNDVESWKEDTDNFSNFENDDHLLGAILQGMFGDSLQNKVVTRVKNKSVDQLFRKHCLNYDDLRNNLKCRVCDHFHDISVKDSSPPLVCEMCDVPLDASYYQEYQEHVQHQGKLYLQLTGKRIREFISFEVWALRQSPAL